MMSITWADWTSNDPKTQPEYCVLRCVNNEVKAKASMFKFCIFFEFEIEAFFAW